MNNIDFLPESYAIQGEARRSRLWQLAVVLVFGSAVGGAAAYQLICRQTVQRDMDEILIEYAAADAKNTLYAQLQSRRNAADELARLYTFLNHPWPRTRILAEIVEPLPAAIALSEFKVVQVAREAAHAAKTRGSLRTVQREDLQRLSPARRDLLQLRQELESYQTVADVSGVTTDTSVLHLYVARLGTSPLFAKAELDSLESVVMEGFSSAARFNVRLIIRPGYGEPGGPQHPPGDLAELPAVGDTLP